MPTVHLTSRAIVSIDGPEAEHFLQNLITPDLAALAPGEAKPGALLTPQGKILFDFLIFQSDDGLRLECRADIADDLVKRLTIYKLRAKVGIVKQDQALVAVSWGDDSRSSQSGSSVRDLRFEDVVLRHYATTPPATADEATWTALRAQNGIAESGADYDLSDVFPHDVLYDQNGGVGLRKGCFVGQEVVSRMQHRGTARRRVMIAASDDALPDAGTEITVDGRPVGTLGSNARGKGIAIVRIDRVKDALDAGHDILAGDARLTLTIPAWARYTLPEPKTAD
ncbi:folate-binding protein YgfZ [Mesorhizobium sp. YIM 152430]|uniref:CAF17-like 4Fe-4S cluster assembly/insertion protein YgfZ n=1 Tax=Mesorhizobium sp. YIM 152430 TaxID=3031761 RepID=UPI0023D9B297|nr:folate-binding protein YgfZ [Mesorhizobium sp. YIM 152430]MDF1600492.1 folate-binding protein YgfZ [Mesorhizobium sp. YIM 152430]